MNADAPAGGPVRPADPADADPAGAAGPAGSADLDADDEVAQTALAARVLGLLRERGETVAVAESLTGGLLAAALVAVPGASQAFRGSVTAYATDLKGSVLGVDRDLLAARGAVDPDVAKGMADGVRRVARADWGAATTGVAGPEPQDGKPVGTVFVSVTGPGGESTTPLLLSGDRATIRRKAVAAALRLLARTLTAAEPSHGRDRS